jgi:hypothetical protein
LRVCNGMKQIPLHRTIGGSNSRPASRRFAVVAFSKVDDWWYDRLIAMGLWLEKRVKYTSYARLQGTGGRGRSKEVFMHQVVAGFDAPDHVNGDGLDNREEDLRKASRSDQAANRRVQRDSTSGEPGVSWNGSGWSVRVYRDGKCVVYKTFRTKQEAVDVARQKRLEIHGDFVRTS